MKKIIILISILFLCSCSSKYKMIDLPEPVRDEFTENINFYVYRTHGITSEQFKDAFGIDDEVDISIEDFRLVFLSKNIKENPKLNDAMLYFIDYKGHPANYLDQEVTYNPWTKELSEILGHDVVALQQHINDTANFCTTCYFNFSNEDTWRFQLASNNVYYFGDATEEEIENYFRSLHLNFNVSGKHTLQYSPKWSMDHSYLINDVNIYVENEDGVLERKQ